MLSPEKYAVIITHMRNSQMSKMAHIRYTAEKCFRLRENQLRLAGQCREDAALFSPVQNKQYSLIKHFTREQEHKEGHDKRVLNLLREQYQLTGSVQQQLSDVASGLMRSADTLLFTLLKAQHYQWRDRLYMSVLTGDADNVLSEESACPLGHWLHGEGMRRFRALPGFRELRDCHHEMHEASAVLFESHPDEMSVARLERLLRQTEDTSQRLITLLEQLDERVSLLYPGG